MPSNDPRFDGDESGGGRLDGRRPAADSPADGRSSGVTGLEEMQRLHPLTLIHRFVISLPALFLALLPALRNPDASSWFYIGSLLLYGIFVVPLLVVQYLRFRYRVSEDEIVIHRGVFTYRHRNIPIERIQNIEIEQSLLSRLLGTAKVKVETAGSATTEGVIEYVALSKAHAIRATVRAHQEAKRKQKAERDTGTPSYAPAVPAPSLESEEAAEGPSAPLLHAMPLQRVLLSGVFRFSLLYIVLIFSATEYLGLNPDDFARWIAGDRLDVFLATMERSPVIIVVTTTLMIVLLAWITGIVTNFNRFYGFRLTLEENKLHTRQGFLTVSEGTIPLPKIQAFVIRTNPLMSAFGWYRLELQTIGFDPSDRGYQVAAPFARRDEILDVARAIRPVDEPAPFDSVSRLMIRRTFARYAAVLTVLTGAAAFFWTDALWAFTALPVLLYVAFLQYRKHGYRATSEYLFVQRGVFRQSIWIMPIERFQVFYATQSLFQKRLGLRSVYVDTPGAGVMAHAVVVDLPDQTGSSLVMQLYDTFQRRMEDLPKRGRSPD